LANVHKDFHGALSYGLRFLRERHGDEGVRTFLSGLAETAYGPLVDDLRERGLPALRDHWRRIYDLEGGDVEMVLTEDELVLHVHRCPAIWHMKEHDYPIADNFCEHTRIVNDAICRAAGYVAEVDYDQGAGRCVQRFRRAAP
jgi:hypothetical protein